MKINEQEFALRKTIGQCVKKMRKEQKLSVYKTAKVAEITIQSLQAIESADSAYTAASLMKLLLAFDAKEIIIVTEEKKYSIQTPKSK